MSENRFPAQFVPLLLLMITSDHQFSVAAVADLLRADDETEAVGRYMETFLCVRVCLCFVV